MHHLDLRNFADHSQKIPSILLNRTQAKKVSTMHILGAHFLDFFVVFYGVESLSIILQASTSSFLGSARLARIAEAHSPFMLLFPALLFCYFFFCNYLNHGQSFGQHKFKLRQSMQEYSFQDSLKGAVWSFLLCASFGSLITKYKENVQMQEHDWVYQELMRVKDEKTIDLLSCVETYAAPAQVEEEDFRIAA